MSELTEGQQAVLDDIREHGITGDEARNRALIASITSGPLTSPLTDEQRADVVAFWGTVAEMCDNGTADWL